MDLISLVVTVVLLGLVFYVLYWAISKVPLPEPFRTVATVLLALAAVVILLGMLLGGISIPLRLR